MKIPNRSGKTNLISGVYGMAHMALPKKRPKRLRGRRRGKSFNGVSPSRIAVELPDATPAKIAFANKLKAEMTPSEQRLWKYLQRCKKHGLVFTTQHVVFGWIADFYCAQFGLVVEIDGSVHNTPEQKAYDAHRNQVMRDAGLAVARFTVDQVMGNICPVLKEIRRLCRPR